MFDIEMTPMTPEFAECWTAAGKYLQSQMEGGMGAWLKSYPYPPFLEHLSFRVGNQLFFVRIEDVDNRVAGPSTIAGLKYISNKNGGFACILPMKNIAGIGWTAVNSGWGLIDAYTGSSLNPILAITDEKIEMTEWELQDMGVQIVRDYLRDQGYELMSWQGNPKVDPSIWFVGDSGGPEWVIVRVVKYPTRKAARPDSWDSIANSCSKLSSVGHFASVGLMCATQSSEGGLTSSLPRGEGMIVSFSGLE